LCDSVNVGNDRYTNFRALASASRPIYHIVLVQVVIRMIMLIASPFVSTNDGVCFTLLCSYVHVFLFTACAVGHDVCLVEADHRCFFVVQIFSYTDNDRAFRHRLHR
jgi:hypothetical protein